MSQKSLYIKVVLEGCGFNSLVVFEGRSVAVGFHRYSERNSGLGFVSG